MSTMTLTLTHHGLNRALSRGYEASALTEIEKVGNMLCQALDASSPMLNGKMLKFKYRGRIYSGTTGRIKTVVDIGDRTYVIGLNPDRTPTVITVLPPKNTNREV